jgi:hypothetical protein
MSVPLSLPTQFRIVSVRNEEARGPSLVSRSWGELADTASPHAIAARDVINEVHIRMARRGYQWD